MRAALFGSLIFAATLLLASDTFAQTPAPDIWSRGTTLSLFAGSANAPPTTAKTFGAAVGWELNHRLELEGVGAWLPENKGTQAYTAEFKAAVNLTHPARTVPYLTGGVGMYRTTVEPALATLPHFYQQRIGLSAVARRTFDDPSFVAGGGANVYIARHFSLRPELTVRFVTNGSDAYRVTLANVSIAYHVEEHEIGK